MIMITIRRSCDRLENSWEGGRCWCSPCWIQSLQVIIIIITIKVIVVSLLAIMIMIIIIIVIIDNSWISESQQLQLEGRQSKGPFLREPSSYNPPPCLLLLYVYLFVAQFCRICCQSIFLQFSIKIYAASQIKMMNMVVHTKYIMVITHGSQRQTRGQYKIHLLGDKSWFWSQPEPAAWSRRPWRACAPDIKPSSN